MGLLFDPCKGAEKIRKRLQSEVMLFLYSDFVSGFPGKTLLRWLLTAETNSSNELFLEIYV